MSPNHVRGYERFTRLCERGKGANPHYNSNVRLSMTKQLRSSLIAGFALAVTLSVVTVAAFDPPPPDETAAPTATPTPVLREVTNFDFTKQAANEDIYLNWSEWGCFHQRFFRIRIAGDDPTHAEVFVLSPPTGNEALKSVTSLTPREADVLTSGTVTLDSKERAGVALWLLRIRGDSDRRCTTSVQLDLYRVTKSSEGETIDHEAFVDASCGFTSKWTESLQARVSEAMQTL